MNRILCVRFDAHMSMYLFKIQARTAMKNLYRNHNHTVSSPGNRNTSVVGASYPFGAPNFTPSLLWFPLQKEMLTI